MSAAISDLLDKLEFVKISYLGNNRCAICNYINNMVTSVYTIMCSFARI